MQQQENTQQNGNGEKGKNPEKQNTSYVNKLLSTAKQFYAMSVKYITNLFAKADTTKGNSGNNGNGGANSGNSGTSGNGGSSSGNSGSNGNGGSNNGNNANNGNSSNGNGNGHDNGNNEKDNGKDKQQHDKGKNKIKPWQAEITGQDVELGYQTYMEKPDYLLDITSRAEYTYDAAFNRLSMETDNEKAAYSYDANDRMISDGSSQYGYDKNGNMTEVKDGEEGVKYTYTPSNKLEKVEYPDGTYVRYGYDAFGRKVYREEAYWDKIEGAKNNGNGKSENAPVQGI
ncbi:MAG: hypothetical protein M1308_10975, partial [Actinobacteria bacterium]|nr:hypothetical protein [Actinomycetota bacterium]